MRRFWKIWLPLGSVFALIVVCWFLWSRSDISLYSSKLEAMLAKAKADGLPLTPGEVRQRLAIPDRDNAARLYKRALHMLKDAHPAEYKELSALKTTRRSPEAEFKRLAELMAFAKPQLDGVKAASLRPGIDFKRPWEQGPAVLYPEMADMKFAAKLLAWRAMLLSHQGKPMEALDDLDTARRVGIHAGGDPTLIGMLVQLAIFAIASDRLQHVVNEHPTPAVIARAEKLLEGLKTPDVRYSIGQELVMNRICYQMIARDPKFSEIATALASSGPEGERNELALARFSTFNRAFEARTIELMDQLYVDLPKDPSKVLEVEIAMKRLDGVLGSDKTLPTRGAVQLLPVFGQASEALVNIEVTKDLGRAALRLLKEHRPGTLFPDKLPFPTVDLFTGKPFSYRRTETGFLIYGVGRDRKDNNGVLSGEGKNEQGFDVGWRYPEGRQPKSTSPGPSGL